MRLEGAVLPAGSIGEIVIRGTNVTNGYDGNPIANEQSFRSGWFRAGDQGVLDSQGHLRLTGRLTEIINRAAERVAPLAIDDVLMEHPAVQLAVTFAMPSKVFGEDVAAAVVLREGESFDETALRAFVTERLAPVKAPRQNPDYGGMLNRTETGQWSDRRSFDAGSVSR
jgi:acyl-CoA synthetase (AMP-forming)/AMP-acid ligase II